MLCNRLLLIIKIWTAVESETMFSLLQEKFLQTGQNPIGKTSLREEELRAKGSDN